MVMAFGGPINGRRSSSNYLAAAVLASASVTASCAPAAAPTPTKIELGPIERVSARGENIQQVWAHADAADGRHLIACGMSSYPQRSVTYGYVYFSADGGTTWRRTLVDDTTGWVSEEACAYGDNGAAYFVDGESDTSTGMPRHEWGHMQAFVSTDYGASWQRAARRGFLDWSILAVLPADRTHSESLAIFGNQSADEPGHWSDKRPVAFEATGGAQSLSPDAFPPTNFVASFGGGSVSLPDRTALFIVGTTAERDEKEASKHRQLKVFAYSPLEQKLEVRASLPIEPGHLISASSMLLRDQRGRLYASWSDFTLRGTARVLLATSDDDGYHWSARAILSAPGSRGTVCADAGNERPSDVRIAMSRAGLLGALWSMGSEALYFSVSTDSGRTFYPSTMIATQRGGKLTVTNAVSFNEWWLAEVLAGQAGKSVDEFIDLKHLGLSVRMSKPQGLEDFALTADTRNGFHALWAGADGEGNHVLMTRAIAVTPGAGNSNGQLAAAGVGHSCTEGTTLPDLDRPRSRPHFDIGGQSDVTAALKLRVERIDYAADSHTVSVQVALMNDGARALRGSLSLFAVGLHSDFGVPTALNASGVQHGHPFWDLSRVIPAEGLNPKSSSEPVGLIFKLEDFSDAPTTGDAVAMWVTVYQNPAT